MSSDSVIVHFVADDTVDIAYKSWIELGNTDESLNYTYWPTTASSKKAVRKSDPDKDIWQKYEIRIMGYASNYPSAVNKLKVSEYTSNLDSEEEGRKRWKPERYSDHDEISNADSDDADSDDTT